MSHEQTRPDCDQYIEVIWNNIRQGWNREYTRLDETKTLGIPYDYASNMHYSGYGNDPLVDMRAKESRYQHTMGSRYGPIFNDIRFVNEYNGCMCKPRMMLCLNRGFPHPRDCGRRCVCPEGFGGVDCSERQEGQHGAPKDCGATIKATLDANAMWKYVTVSVPAPKPFEPPETPDKYNSITDHH